MPNNRINIVQKPYRAMLKDGVWIVEGSLPKGWVGGVLLQRSRKKTGES